jgi:hypothetical protein
MQTTDLAAYRRELLVELYRRMVLVREFELRAIEERRAGLIPGFIHSCVGQEALAVGACLALQADDVITSTHRGHGHLIGKGGDPRFMMAELAARSTGYSRGRGGSLHIADFDLGILASLLTTERLLFDLYDHPAEVMRLVNSLTRLWLRYYDDLYALIEPAGRGTTPWAAIWSPARCYMLQSDFAE